MTALEFLSFYDKKPHNELKFRSILDRILVCGRVDVSNN